MHLIIEILPWALSANTIWMTALAGSQKRFAWAVALAGQAGWLGWILLAGEWGFLPMNLALWVVYYRNHRLWMAPGKRLQLRLDRDDAEAIEEAVAERLSWRVNGEEIMPPGDSCLVGSALGEVCRGWLDTVGAAKEPLGDNVIPFRRPGGV